MAPTAASLCRGPNGCETRVFHAGGLPLPKDAEASHPKVQELRGLSLWSEGQVWTGPERHGAMTGVMKSRPTGSRLRWGRSGRPRGAPWR
ncbi:NAD(P)H-dependent oxidoreductase [Paracoccus angustae]|uniref:NAD(P)H-dependent oxidoreductase n=1 Tax=Paracoccus angustae TaxID=1671480 RepID=A0ABV7U6I4_9RHOB